MYVGKQMIAVTMPNAWKLSLGGMFVIPKTVIFHQRKCRLAKWRTLTGCDEC